MHLCIILVGNDLMHNFSMISSFNPLKSPKCLCAHPQEDNCVNTTSGIINLCQWPSSMLDGH